MKIYIAGPYSSDPLNNTLIAIKAGNHLADLGYTVFIPHLTYYWHDLYPHEYEFWLKQDLEWLSVCDCLIRLPGHSAGANEEVKYARAHDIPVFYGVGDFLTRNYIVKNKNRSRDADKL